MHDFDAGGLGLVHDGGDVFFVILERHALGAVPDIIDAATQGHPLRFLAQHITVQAFQHLVGFVAADAGADDFDFHAIGRQAAADQLHIAAGAALALVGDGVAEEGHFVARFHGDFGL